MNQNNQEHATWDDLDWGGMVLEAPTPPEPLSEIAMAPLPSSAELRPLSVSTPTPHRPQAEVSRTQRLVSEVSAHVFVPESTATLTLTSMAGVESVITVTGDFTVGRKKDNDLVIKDRHISGYHAKLVRLVDGAFELHDLDSSGGTVVNGESVKVHRLTSGDEIDFATVRAVFHYVAGPQFDDEMEFAGTLVHAKPAKDAQPAPATARLIVHMPDGSVLTAEIHRELTVGRMEDNALVISQEHVSSHHARLVCHAGGIVEIIDLNSTCGTFVNGKQIDQKSLAGGEQLRFGTVVAVLETSASLAKKAAQPVVAERPALRRTDEPIPTPKPAATPQKPPLVKRSGL